MNLPASREVYTRTLVDNPELPVLPPDPGWEARVCGLSFWYRNLSFEKTEVLQDTEVTYVFRSTVCFFFQSKYYCLLGLFFWII